MNNTFDNVNSLCSNARRLGLASPCSLSPQRLPNRLFLSSSSQAKNFCDGLRDRSLTKSNHLTFARLYSSILDIDGTRRVVLASQP